MKPHYADMIVSAIKRVEFRRAWAAEGVSSIAIYASSPIQKIVAVVDVDKIVHCGSAALWTYCSTLGGGLTRAELTEYFSDKEKGYAVILGKVKRFKIPFSPAGVIENFTAPQSFRYLTSTELQKISKRAFFQ